MTLKNLEAKKYIEPYKEYYLKCFKELEATVKKYLKVSTNVNLDYIEHIKEVVLIKTEDMFCCVQIGSFTNMYRVNLIKDFEKKLILETLNLVKDFITEENKKEYREILKGKLRFDLSQLII